MASAVVDRKERRRKWWTQKLKTKVKREKDDTLQRGAGGGRERGKATDLDTRLSRKQTITKDKQQTVSSSSSSLLECGTSSAGFRSKVTTPLDTARHSGERKGRKDLPTNPHLTNRQTDTVYCSNSDSESITDHPSQPFSDQGGGGEMRIKRRYIAFVGNLPYSATAEEVVEHFAKRGVKLVDTRLLTKKDGGESRGCCFVEFSNSKSLQNGLKFNHTLMAGRRLNVEVTCGGGGRGERRTNKIRERNERLKKARRKKIKNQKNQKVGD